LGRTISPISGKQVQKDTTETIIKELFERQEDGAKFYILFPIELREGRKIAEQLAVFKEKGLVRLLNIEDESMVDLSGDDVDIKKIKPKTHRVLVDRLAIKKDDDTRSRIADSIETAFREGNGRCSIKIRNGEELIFSERFERDGMEFLEPSPRCSPSIIHSAPVIHARDLAG
jgi:excinuclease ABC subunit A